jgi:hypothetical protein
LGLEEEDRGEGTPAPEEEEGRRKKEDLEKIGSSKTLEPACPQAGWAWKRKTGVRAPRLQKRKKEDGRRKTEDGRKKIWRR